MIIQNKFLQAQIQQEAAGQFTHIQFTEEGEKFTELWAPQEDFIKHDCVWFKTHLEQQIFTALN